MRRNLVDWSKRILVILFVLINCIVLYNAIVHMPYIGYDAKALIRNIIVLSEFRLPKPKDTYMFYMPPLVYSLPALLYASKIFDLFVVLKIEQLLNVLFSVGLTFYLLKICDIIRPSKTLYKILSLSFLGMLPVYYKTFAFIRGEPLVAFLTVFAIYKTLIIFVNGDYRLRNILVLGVILGLMILSRQTGLFVFPAIFIFVVVLLFKERAKWRSFLKSIALILLIAFIIGGWFYIRLHTNYGTVATYNIKPKDKFSFSNQPSKFYLNLGTDKLFTDPVRPSFPNQFFPTFYSETWGDYLCYFLVYGRDIRNQQLIGGVVLKDLIDKEGLSSWLRTNRYTINRFLGRVNLVSLYPSALILASFILGTVYLIKWVMKKEGYREIYSMFSLLHLIIVVSFVAFMYFLIMYPSPQKGDNIKATYMLHVFPFFSILAGELVYRIRQRSVFWYAVILILLILSASHNLPAFFTRYHP